MSDAELILALGHKWRSMPDTEPKMALGVALDALLQQYYGCDSCYDWSKQRAALIRQRGEKGDG